MYITIKSVIINNTSEIVKSIKLYTQKSLWFYSGYIYKWPPLWSSGQSSWLQIQKFGFDFLRYQIFWEVASLERGPPQPHVYSWGATWKK
jgi:hypothetical protein